MSFPAGFLWGTATAAHQVEGGNVNNDSWLAGARAGHRTTPSRSGDACDHYHRYRRGHRADRRTRPRAPTASRSSGRASSPRTGEFSRPRSTTTGACCACHEHGLDADAHVPPLHLAALDRRRRRLGGRAHGRAVRPLLRARDASPRRPRAVRVHAQRAEPRRVPARGPRRADPARQRRLGRGRRGAADDARAARPVPARGEPARPSRSCARRTGSRSRRSRACAPRRRSASRSPLSEWQAAPGGERDAGSGSRGLSEDVFLEGVEGDFVGVQNYSGHRIGPGRPGRARRRRPSARRWATPSGPRRWSTRSGAAVELTGPAGHRDRERHRHGRRHAPRATSSTRALRGRRAVPAPTASTCAATSTGRCFDNFEWVLGYRPTFGLVAVDRETQVRRPKPSARRFGEIARANAVTREP